MLIYWSRRLIANVVMDTVFVVAQVIFAATLAVCLRVTKQPYWWLEQDKARVFLYYIVLCLSMMISRAAPAVVWEDADIDPPSQQTGVMKHVGRMLYSRFGVFGGTCVWVGGRWALTARHGVGSWSPQTLVVDFPAHGKQRYALQAIHLPADEKVDLALLELRQAPKFAEPPMLARQELQAGVKVRFGGYGQFGPAGKITGWNRFHFGTNTLDSASPRLARFSLGRATQTEPYEALPAMFDSGSPVFAEQDRQCWLIGIVIRVSNGARPQVGDRATLTCLSGQADWMQEIATDLQWSQ